MPHVLPLYDISGIKSSRVCGEAECWLRVNLHVVRRSCGFSVGDEGPSSSRNEGDVHNVVIVPS